LRQCINDSESKITTSICEKEKKSSSYSTNKLESLSEEKQAKIKKFAKSYLQKLLSKMRKTGSSSSAPNPNGAVLSPGSDQTSPRADSTAMEPHITSAEVADIMDDIDMDASDNENHDVTMEEALDDTASMAEDCSPMDAQLVELPEILQGSRGRPADDLSPSPDSTPVIPTTTLGS
jgi:hypothetical protein